MHFQIIRHLHNLAVHYKLLNMSDFEYENLSGSLSLSAEKNKTLSYLSFLLSHQ